MVFYITCISPQLSSGLRMGTIPYFLQAPDKFVAAAARNPVCNISSMVGITDIPDWCYVEAYGSNGKSIFTEAPSAEHLTHFYNKSPISHISKVH